MNTNIDNNNLPPPPTDVGEDKKDSGNMKENPKKMENKKQKKNEEKEAEMESGTTVQFQQPTLLQPIPGLPLELFVTIITLLDPFMIALCHLVCKPWRMSILLHSVLYAELDLSRLGIGVEDRILQSFPDYFLQLSSRANDRLVKISLNVFSLWKDYIAKNQVYENTFAFEFFGTLLLRSRQNLREISLRFVLEGADFCKFNLSFFPFLSSTLQQLQSYPLLNSIYIEGPSSVSFTLRSDQDPVRVFEIQDNFEELAEGADNLSDESDDDYEQPEVSHFAPIVECGKRFLGEQAYFSQFETDRYLEDPYQNSSSLVDLLSDSTSTLEILQLDSTTVRGSDLWSLVIQCDKLKALRIALPLLIDHAEERAFVELKSPEVSLINSNLQSLSLESYGWLFG